MPKLVAANGCRVWQSVSASGLGHGGALAHSRTPSQWNNASVRDVEHMGRLEWSSFQFGEAGARVSQASSVGEDWHRHDIIWGRPRYAWVTSGLLRDVANLQCYIYLAIANAEHVRSFRRWHQRAGG